MGIVDKIKDLFSSNPSMVDKAADAVEQNVTEERTDQVLNKVPGGDKVDEYVPEDAGSKAADAMRDNLKRPGN